jgi:ActR/RegA family two-component response regulator
MRIFYIQMPRNAKSTITDDDQKLLKMLKRTLAYENMDVLTASTGVEALEIVRQQKPDLIDPGLDDAGDGRGWSSSRGCAP